MVEGSETPPPFPHPSTIPSQHPLTSAQTSELVLSATISSESVNISGKTAREASQKQKKHQLRLMRLI
jgi:hypothetical protein